MGNCELKITQALRDKVSTYNTTPEHIADARLSGETTSAISRETGIPRTTLMSILRDMGLGEVKNKWGKQNKIDEKWLREQLVDKRREVREVASELGISKNVVWRAATAAGIMEERKTSKADTICVRKGVSPDWLCEQVVEKHRTNKDIAAELGWSAAMVSRARKEEGIEVASIKPRAVNEKSKSAGSSATMKRHAYGLAAEKLVREIEQWREPLESGETTRAALAEKYGISETSVRRICQEHSIGKYIPNVFDKYNITEEWLRHQRVDLLRTIEDIAKETGCPKGSIYRVCKRLGIAGHMTARSQLGKMGITREWLIEEHLAKHRSCGEIADELGVQRNIVEYECNKYDISTSVHYVCAESGIDEKMLFELIDEKGIKADVLAKQLKVEKRWIEDIFLSYDINGSISPYDLRRFLLSSEWLYEQRINKLRSVKDIAQETGVPYKTMKKICDSNDLCGRAVPTAEKYGFTNKWFEDKRSEGVSQRELARQLEGTMSRTTIKRIYREIDKENAPYAEVAFKENRNALFRREMERIATAKNEERKSQYAAVSRGEKYGIDYDWLYQRLIIEQKTTKEMCELLGVSKGTFSDICFEIGLEKHKLPLCEQYAISAEHLKDLRQKQNMGYKQIAEKLDVPYQQIKYMCYEEGIDKYDVDTFYKIYDTDYDALYEMRATNAQSFKDIAEKLGCPTEDLRCVCYALHIPSYIQLSFAERNNISYDDVKALVDDPKCNLNNIAKALGVSARIAERVLREYGFEVPHNATHSAQEDAWEKFLIDNDIEYSLRQQCLRSENNSSQEIDILIKEHGIGLEISPAYTHNHDSEPHWGGGVKSTVYHQKKAMAAEALGINLVHIFDWQDIEKMKNIILSLCGKNKRLYARNCEVHRFDDSRTEKAFFEENHLQGYLKSECAYGLYHNGELVAAMSFTSPRYGNKEQAEWELLRFASKAGITVVGGASKLFATFKKEQTPKSVMSFANYDISNGNLYEKLGFEYVRTTKPSFYWIKNDGSGEFYSWYLIQKKGVDAIFNTNYGKGTSNIALMLDMGFVRVYNCGNKVYLWCTE